MLSRRYKQAQLPLLQCRYQCINAVPGALEIPALFECRNKMRIEDSFGFSIGQNSFNTIAIANAYPVIGFGDANCDAVIFAFRSYTPDIRDMDRQAVKSPG